MTKGAEKLNDVFLKKASFELLQSDKYCKAVWYVCGVEQKKTILCNFLKDLKAILNVEVSENIEFYCDDSGSQGSYIHKKRCIRINEDFLKEQSSYKIMQTMIHEMRHAYQHGAVENPQKFTVSSETIGHWKKNFSSNHYFRVYSRENYETKEEYNKAYILYVSQPVEFDAKNFANQFTDIIDAEPIYLGSWID